MTQVTSIKNILFILFIGLLSIFVACSSDNDTDPEVEAERIADSLAQSVIENTIIDEYMANNGISGLTISETTGIRYGVITPGTGTFPEFNDIVSIDYVGKFILDVDSVFDASNEQVARDNDVYNELISYQPITFNMTPAGTGVSPFFLPQFRVALGKVVQDMDLGATAILFMPSPTAYGLTGDQGDESVEDVIPPNTPILFEFKLVRIRD